MKCPKCSSNHKRKTGMRCSCGYMFVFDPKVDKIADGKFAAALNKASANDTNYFTLNQLDAAIRRASAKNPRTAAIVCLVLVLVLVAAYYLNAPDGLLIFLMIPTGLSLIVFLVIALHKPEHLKIETLIERWQKRNGAIEKLVSEPKLHNPPPDWKEPDIYSYGVERILFVERDILVDLLVKNGFHAEQRCLILSEHGYPSYIEARAQRMLKESPDTKVFVMHDSTQTGVEMKGRVIAKYGLENNPPVDLGIFPDDWKKLKAAEPLGLRHQGYEAPVDMIPYSRLGAVTTAAFVAGIPFAMLPPATRDPSQSGSDGGSFG